MNFGASYSLKKVNNDWISMEMNVYFNKQTAAKVYEKRYKNKWREEKKNHLQMKIYYFSQKWFWRIIAHKEMGWLRFGHQTKWEVKKVGKNHDNNNSSKIQEPCACVVLCCALNLFRFVFDFILKYLRAQADSFFETWIVPNAKGNLFFPFKVYA